MQSSSFLSYSFTLPKANAAVPPPSLSPFSAPFPKPATRTNLRLTTRAAMSPPSTALLESAVPFLRGNLEEVDPTLPSMVAFLRSAGAGECWHKQGTLLGHLLGLYRILKLWGCPDAACRCGLFHSTYSNFYTELALFDHRTSRPRVRSLVGDAAERLIHLYCSVPRQPLIHDDLLFKYSDEEIVEHLRESAPDNGGRGGGRWREKVRQLVPEEGVVVRNIKAAGGEDIRVSRRVVAFFLLMTMGDFSDQLSGFQDELFDNSDGRLDYEGNSFTALWPGSAKPGLWMNSISRMGGIYTLLLREEQLFIEERIRAGGIEVDPLRDENLELVIPPVFDNCTKVLDPQDQTMARDLYWEAQHGVLQSSNDKSKGVGLKKAEELLLRSIERNPFVGEPHVVLGHVYMSMGRFEEAEKEAERGLALMLGWGNPWDKRMSWEAWIAWSRVLLLNAEEKSWPQTSWGILNLGQVKK